MEDIITSEFKSTERLFHYTSQAGLNGILSSGSLWATHYSFLNDKKEIVAAEQSLGAYLSKRLAAQMAAHKIMHRHPDVWVGMDIRDTAPKEAARIVEIIYAAALKFVNPFIASFFVCDSHSAPTIFRDGLLRHWATYGRDGGYALQLAPEKVKSALEYDAKHFTHSGIFLTRVAYLNESQDSIPDELRPSYESLAATAIKMVNHQLDGLTEDEALYRAIEGSYSPFARAICSVKSSYFSDEREARVATFRPTNEAVKRAKQTAAHPISLRDGGIPIPYITLFGGELLSTGCVEKIIIGPHPENELRKKALELYLESRDFEIPVSISEVPYVTRR